MKRNARMSVLILLGLTVVLSAFAAGSKEGTIQAVKDGTKEIEFISCYGPGGGHDTMLRNMEKAMRANNLLKNPVFYTYKPGGAQAVGMAYTFNQAGRADCIMSTTLQLVGTPLIMDIGKFGWRDLTPLAMWGETYSFLFVNSKSGFNTLQDLINSGKPITFSSSGAGTTEEIIVAFLKSKHPKVDFQTVPINGDAESLTQLLGGHIDVFINELGGLEQYVESGEIKILASSGSARSAFVPNIPTFRDMGYDFDCIGFRGVMGPPKMPKEAVDFYVDLFTKMYDTQDFKKYRAVNGVEPIFKTKEDFGKYLETIEAGVIKQYNLVGIKMIKK